MDIVYVVVIQKGEEAVGEDKSEEGQSSQRQSYYSTTVTLQTPGKLVLP